MFLAGGVDLLDRLETDRVLSNRRRRDPRLAFEPAPLRAPPPSVTIEYVSVDGTFRASAHERRMFNWATSIAEERNSLG